jgi:transposase InsO family protein
VPRPGGTTPAGLYEWLAAEPARRQRVQADEDLAGQIRAIHGEHHGTYGSPRVTDELRRRGRPVNRKRVERIMRERGIAGITRRPRRSLTKPDTAAVPAPDLISRDFTAPAPGRRLVGDITYLPTAEGWLYLPPPSTCSTARSSATPWPSTCAPTSSAGPSA